MLHPNKEGHQAMIQIEHNGMHAHDDLLHRRITVRYPKGKSMQAVVGMARRVTAHPVKLLSVADGANAFAPNDWMFAYFSIDKR